MSSSSSYPPRDLIPPQSMPSSKPPRQKLSGSFSSSAAAPAVPDPIGLSASPRKSRISWDQASFANTASSSGYGGHSGGGSGGGDFHRRQDSSLASLEELMNKDDQAERGLLHSMESRRSQTHTSGGDLWHASVQGERPPLGGAVPLQLQDLLHHSHHNNSSANASTGTGTGGSQHKMSEVSSEGSRGSSQNSATKLADIARRMRQKAAGVEPTLSASPNSSFAISASVTTASSNHRRGQSRAHALLDSIQEHGDENNNNDNNSNPFDGVTVVGTGSNTTTTGDAQQDSNGTSDAALELAQATSSADRLITGAMHVEDLFDDSPAPSADATATAEDDPPTVETVTEDEDEQLLQLAGEHVPLMASPSMSKSYQGSVRSSNSKRPLPIPPSPGHRRSSSDHHDSPKVLRKKAAAKKKSWWWKSVCWTCCHPMDFLKRIWHLLWYQSLVLTIAMPCFVGAAIMFYGLYNPFWNFLPGHASIAWWLNFFGRQILLLELARIWQWCFIDKLVLGTRIAVQCLGPLLTLCLIQARGWPFTVATWGFLDLMLLEGSSQFERHWLYFTPFTLYESGENNDSGSYVLTSDYYVRLLLCMMLAGWSTAIKRTAVAMYFGRRTFVEFKPRLERLLKDVVLVTEMAALAEEAEIAAAEEEQQRLLAARRHSRGVLLSRETGASKVNLLGDVSWNNRGSRRRKSNRANTNPQQPRPRTVPSSPTSEDGSDSDDDDDDDDDDASEITTQNDIKPESERFQLRQTDSGSLRVRDLLDHWDEPVNKMDKSLNASISDILRFRRALTFMDDEQPFGEHFGPASNRDQMINSAHDVYQSLLKLTPGRNKLSCEFYTMLSLGDDGETVNLGKQKALRKLFRPDKNNELSLLAFVQCCDSLYKKLRYFRANVGNASVIDHALESIVDGAFSFVLALILLSVMRINPWPLLVSISTLLVSVSFAVGSSASKWFEGMLLVAARRPFDLGDRIYMTEPSLVNSDGLWYCWFVEDINLFHTTIRYAGTNEVATINNGSVANMRIMNGARSPNAAVWFQFPYRVNLLEDGNIDKMKAALENYARENPRNWHSFSYFRVDEVHPDLEKLVVTIGMQHRSSWQDLVTILEAKGKVMCWLLEYGRKLGVNYDELPKRDLFYYAGALKDGSVGQHRFQLHNPSNITNHWFPDPSSLSNMNEGNSAKAPTAQESSNAKFLAQLIQSHG